MKKEDEKYPIIKVYDDGSYDKVEVTKPRRRFQGQDPGRSVLISQRHYSAAHIMQGQPKNAPLVFDPAATTMDETYAYAITRKWRVIGEPNVIGMYEYEDLGPLNDETAQAAQQPAEGELAVQNR